MKRRDIINFFKDMGGEVIELVANKHWKVKARFGDKTINVVMSFTASDRRAYLNQVSTVKRLLREHAA